jgi:hypothetical protein
LDNSSNRIFLRRWSDVIAGIVCVTLAILLWIVFKQHSRALDALSTLNH